MQSSPTGGDSSLMPVSTVNPVLVSCSMEYQDRLGLAGPWELRDATTLLASKAGVGFLAVKAHISSAAKPWNGRGGRRKATTASQVNEQLSEIPTVRPALSSPDSHEVGTGRIGSGSWELLQEKQSRPARRLPPACCGDKRSGESWSAAECLSSSNINPHPAEPRLPRTLAPPP